MLNNIFNKRPVAWKVKTNSWTLWKRQVSNWSCTRIWLDRTDKLQMDSPLWTICKKWTGENSNAGWCKSNATKNSWTWNGKWNSKKSNRHIRQNKVKDKIAFINKYKDVYSIEQMCKVLDLNRSTYYKIWIQHVF